MNKIKSYKTSQDYKLLYGLMKKASVICIVDCTKCFDSQSVARDVARTSYLKPSCLTEIYAILSRDVAYFWAENKDWFIKQCIKYNVEFIEPTEVI
jgi:hypothetical protein